MEVGFLAHLHEGKVAETTVLSEGVQTRGWDPGFAFFAAGVAPGAPALVISTGGVVC